MSTFFAFLTCLSSVLLFISIGLGYVHSSSHLLFGLSSAILAVLTHCIIFAIFTGSGKDARLLIEDFKLEPSLLKRAKKFKREVFPPALYAIFALLILTSIGGGVSTTGNPLLGTLHGFVAILVMAYNLRVFWIEYKAVKENSHFIKELNQIAAQMTTSETHPRSSTTDTLLEFKTGSNEETVLDLNWDSHAHALGKFLVFLAWNCWLVWIYVRWIMGHVWIPTWPFALLSVGFYLVGFFLKRRYSKNITFVNG